MNEEQNSREKLNADLRSWSEATKKDLRSTMNRLSIHETGELMKSVSYKMSMNYGQVNRIRLRFQRYGIFVEKGAGRGYGGSKGSKWIDKKSSSHQTNSASLGKMGTGKRKAKPWFNPTMDTDIDKLSEVIVRDYGDIITANFSHFKIK